MNMRAKIILCLFLTISSTSSTHSLAVSDYNRAAVIMEKAQKAFANADYTTAIRYYTEVIAADPDFSDEIYSSDALYSRAAAYNNTGYFSKAITDYSRYLKLNPDSGDAYYSRAHAYEGKGEYAEAIADYNHAISLGPTTQIGTVEVYNDLAWLLATCPQAKFRDGKQAVVNAKAAWETSMERSSFVMDTLAAANAETGDFTSAVKWEQKFLARPQLSDEEMKQGRKYLLLYESGRPFHQKITN